MIDVYVKAIRTFNNEKIYGQLMDFYYPTKKMKENRQYVGVVYSLEYNRCFDVYPKSIECNTFNKYLYIS